MWINFAIVTLFLAAMVLIGLHFSKRQQSTDAYFVAGRSLPGWAVGMSLFVTLISSVTFIAYPGAGYEGKWSLMMPGLMTPVVLVVAAYILIPVYRSIIRISTYEYIGQRFNTVVRLYSAFAFSLNNFAKMGFVFYVVALSVTSMTGWNTFAVIFILGIVTVFYTFVGGLEAVIWTDVIQGFLLWAGAIVALGYIVFLPPGGPGDVIALAWQNEMFDFGSLDFDFSRPTLIVLLTIGFVNGLQKWGTDQTVVQRYLVVKNHREAIKSAVLGTVLMIPAWTIFTLIGTCLWSFYQITQEALPETIIKSEQVFPHFLMTHMPVGLNGLILAALMSAAMSTLSSDLNCIAAVGTEDCYRRLRPQATDQQRLRVGKNIVVVCGVLCIGIAMLLVQSQETLLALWFTVASIVSAGIVGIFFLAFMSTRVNSRGIYIGIAGCFLFTIWATMTLNDDSAFDLGFLQTPIHSYMIGVIGHFILVIVGYCASLLFPADGADRRHLTVWGWLDKRKRSVEDSSL